MNGVNIGKAADTKKLKKGFTTGTCAAAAAWGATLMLLSEGSRRPDKIPIVTPKGIKLHLQAEESRMEHQGCSALCCVKKDSGDDPDVTNGALIWARAELLPDQQEQICIEGGMGVGRVTKPGLACKVGEAAINPVPRAMIKKAVSDIRNVFGCKDSLKIEIFVPQGQELAKKTFNPKLGITGGISILGTSGIVEPMSEQALIDTIKVEMNVAKASGAAYLVLTPGNYGERFLRETRAAGELTYVKCSNFIGDALDYAAEQELEGVLLVGHIGKLVKVAAGIMNTHSKYGDRRMEILTEHLEKLGADAADLKECVTTEDAIRLIRERWPELEQPLWDSILKSIGRSMTERTGGRLRTEAMIYSNQYGYLGETKGTGGFLSQALKKEGQKKMGKLYGVGVGPGEWELMTLKAVRIIRESQLIVIPASGQAVNAAYTIAKGAVPNLDKKEILEVSMPMTRDKQKLNDSRDKAAEQIADHLKAGKDVAFLTLGDPSIYSTYIYIHQRLLAAGYEAEMVPGIPSFCAAAAALNEGLTEASDALHVIPASYEGLTEAMEMKGTKILMKSGKSIGAIRDMILDHPDKWSAKMVERCGMEGQRIFTRAEDMDPEASYFSIIVVKDR